jgi:hypothetical protein
VTAKITEIHEFKKILVPNFGQRKLDKLTQWCCFVTDEITKIHELRDSDPKILIKGN